MLAPDKESISNNHKSEIIDYVLIVRNCVPEFQAEVVKYLHKRLCILQ